MTNVDGRTLFVFNTVYLALYHSIGASMEDVKVILDHRCSVPGNTVINMDSGTDDYVVTWEGDRPFGDRCQIAFISKMSKICVSPRHFYFNDNYIYLKYGRGDSSTVYYISKIYDKDDYPSQYCALKGLYLIVRIEIGLSEFMGNTTGSSLRLRVTAPHIGIKELNQTDPLPKQEADIDHNIVLRWVWAGYAILIGGIVFFSICISKCHSCIARKITNANNTRDNDRNHSRIASDSTHRESSVQQQTECSTQKEPQPPAISRNNLHCTVQTSGPCQQPVYSISTSTFINDNPLWDSTAERGSDEERDLPPSYSQLFSNSCYMNR